PIIANGDIKTGDDIMRVRALGYSGAMIGRAVFGRPWIVSEIMGGGAPKNVGEIVLRHLEYAI
ncbi:MAG: tRNA-dihydrouridine synthase, partial [Alphaproteobacteria bacterium]|nr:tRNA-dihydrouridine synthase [Alphaproteobacteria bacterium]